LQNLILSLLTKDPVKRITLAAAKQHPWVNGNEPLPSEADNCHLVTVTDEEVRNSVRNIPRLGENEICARVHTTHMPFRHTDSGESDGATASIWQSIPAAVSESGAS
jgi:serine/threonine protein kinase